MLSIFRLIFSSGILLFLLSVFEQTASGDNLLNTYGIEPKVDRGGLSKLHEDDRGIYYSGVYWTRDKDWDPNAWQWGVIAFVHPRGSEGEIVSGNVSMAELHSQNQPVFRVAAEEMEHFNRALLPRLRAAYPSFDQTERMQITYYAVGHKFKDSKYFEKNSRLGRRAVGDEPLFALGLFRDTTGKLVPYYDVWGAPGQALFVNYGSGEYQAPLYWTSVSAARQDRELKGGSSPDLSARSVEAMSVAELYEHYTTNKTTRDVAASKAIRDSAIAYLEQLRTSGAVFRNRSSWSRYDRSQVLQQIFNREYDRIEDPYESAAIYVSYVAAYYDVCEAHLPPKQFRSRMLRTPILCDDLGCRQNGDTEISLEMHPDFGAKYEAILANAQTGQLLEFLEGFAGALPNWHEGGAFENLNLMFNQTANLFRRERVLEQLLVDDNCAGSDALQLRENLLELVGARSSMIRPTQTPSQNDRVTESDIEQEIAWRKRDAERKLAAQAANPREGPDGWSLAQEDFGDFTVLKAGDLDASLEPGAYREAVSAAKSEKHPVLYCRYGPTGLNGELPTWKKWSFWYGRVPPEAAAIHEFQITRDEGMVEAAVSACPATTGAVERIIVDLE